MNMIHKKKILYIATRSPFPTSGGREKMILQTIEFLKEVYDLYFIYFSSEVNLNSSLVKMLSISRVSTLRPPSFLQIIKNIIFRRKYSFQENLFYSPHNEKVIQGVLEGFKADLLIADMIRCAQFVESSKLPKICEMDDLLSIRYKRALKDNQSDGNIMGTFSNKFSKIFNCLGSGYWGRFVLYLEAKKIRRRELDVARTFDAVTLVSMKEASILQDELKGERIFGIPPTVKRHCFVPSFVDTNSFLFLGNLRTPQNYSSIVFIVKSVLPFFDQHGLNYELNIVGDYDDRAVELIKFNKNVNLLGFVESIDKVILGSKLLLAPISFGTGIKLKILDAMSFGLPVITNSIGIEGIPGQNYKDFIVEDEPDKLAKAAIELCKNDKMLFKIKNGGLSVVRNNFLYKDVSERYLSIIDEVSHV